MTLVITDGEFGGLASALAPELMGIKKQPAMIKNARLTVRWHVSVKPFSSGWPQEMKLIILHRITKF
ncbi:MAG: hypothetical protein ACFWTO_17235 [Hafnia paralvei]